MAKKFHGSSLSLDKSKESRNAGMISEDHSAMANLPQSVIIKEYPKVYSYMPEKLDDTMSGIDRQITFDNGKKNSKLNPKKV